MILTILSFGSAALGTLVWASWMAKDTVRFWNCEEWEWEPGNDPDWSRSQRHALTGPWVGWSLVLGVGFALMGL